MISDRDSQILSVTQGLQGILPTPRLLHLDLAMLTTGQDAPVKQLPPGPGPGCGQAEGHWRIDRTPFA